MSHTPAYLKLCDEARKRIREIQAEELPGMLEKEPGALIDVREESEFAAGHIQGAQHIGKGVIERDIEATHPDRNETLYLYCGGGFRSALAGDALRQMGYKNVVNVDGGWRALKDIMPVET